MQSITINEIVTAIKGKLLTGNKDLPINDITTSSREIKENSIFIALIGEIHDGHTFLEDAYNNGCRSFIIDDNHTFNKENINLISVPNTTKALGDVALYYKSLFNIPYIAVTGSVGKTSTKDIIYSVLKTKYNVLKNEGNFNNEIGVPKTIFNLDKNHELAILELGISKKDEMDYLENIVHPDIAVISNIGMSHIENYKDQEELFMEKLKISKSFNKNNLLLINGDDKLLKTLKNKNQDYKILSYGFDTSNDIYCTKYNIVDDSTTFSCLINNKEEEFFIPSPAKHNILNAMAAILLGIHFNIDINSIKEGLKKLSLTKMRLEIINTNKYKIIDDTYNASSDSMISALDVLKSQKGRKVAILGDIFETGNYEEKIHREVGKNIIGNTNILITIGTSSKYISEEAKNLGFDKDNTYHFYDKEELYKSLESILKKEDVILLKASRGMKLDEVTSFIKEL